MKKLVILTFCSFIFYSCLNNDDDNLMNISYVFLPVDEAITPASFTFGETDSITVKYSFPNGCYSFDRLYYDVRDTTRVVAITAQVVGNTNCTLAIIEGEYKFGVKASQREDYVFKFFKGIDDNDDNIFEEVIIPVN